MMQLLVGLLILVVVAAGAWGAIAVYLWYALKQVIGGRDDQGGES